MAQYLAYSAALVTTGAPAKVALAAGVTKTVLQLTTPSTADFRVYAWGVSFDGSAAAVPVVCELLTTGSIAATVTAFAAGNLGLFSEQAAPASTAVLASSGFNASGEGAISSTRHGDLQLVPPTSGYSMEWPEPREFYIPVSTSLRVRCTAPAVVNCLAWVRWRE